MSRPVFEIAVLALGGAFAAFFCLVVLPPAIAGGDLMNAFAAGFVNPFAAGYSTDVIVCALILCVWIAHERTHLGVRHGWIAVPLCVFPGVAVGFAVYLVIRSRQMAGLVAGAPG